MLPNTYEITGSFSLIDVGSGFHCCVVFSFFFSNRAQAKVLFPLAKDCRVLPHTHLITGLKLKCECCPLGERLQSDAQYI